MSGGRPRQRRSRLSPSRRRRALARVVTGFGAGLLAWACAPPSEPPRAADVAGAAEAPSGELDRGFRSVPMKGQGLELDLPDADGWRHDARASRASRGFVAVHAATRSRLLVRSWSADGLVHPADCERELRRLRPELPAIAPEQRVEERSLRVAGDHAAHLLAGVAPSPARPAELEGFALLFGSDGRHCVALIYSTMAQGSAAPRVIGERLAAMTGVAFEHVRRVGIDQRVRAPRR